MNIRNAAEDDVDFALAGLKETRELSGFSVTEKKTDRGYFLKAIRDGTVRVITVNDENAGFLHFTTEATVKYLENFFYIDIVYVREEHRSRKLGKFLHDDALKIAKRMGYKAVYLDIFGINEPSVRFHNKMGFKPLYTIYKKEI